MTAYPDAQPGDRLRVSYEVVFDHTKWRIFPEHCRPENMTVEVLEKAPPAPKKAKKPKARSSRKGIHSPGPPEGDWLA